LEFEPLHLEAALDYIDLQSLCEMNTQKRLTLLQRAKNEFQQTNDVLSKEYHLAKAKRLDKEKLYQSYLLFFDAQILLAQSETESQKQLQAKAKEIFLKIVEENVHPALTLRARRCLEE
jgi:hypothetical protein